MKHVQRQGQQLGEPPNEPQCGWEEAVACPKLPNAEVIPTQPQMTPQRPVKAAGLVGWRRAVLRFPFAAD
jgi:hypothetical protein